MASGRWFAPSCLHISQIDFNQMLSPKVSTSDFQSEVGEVFGEIGGELRAKFGRRFSSFFCWGNRQKHFPPKLHRKFHHQTSLRGSGSWWALQRDSKFQAPDLADPARAQDFTEGLLEWGRFLGSRQTDASLQKTGLEQKKGSFGRAVFLSGGSVF